MQIFTKIFRGEPSWRSTRLPSLITLRTICLEISVLTDRCPDENKTTKKKQKRIRTAKTVDLHTHRDLNTESCDLVIYRQQTTNLTRNVLDFRVRLPTYTAYIASSLTSAHS